jgi:hypothetical protein
LSQSPLPTLIPTGAQGLLNRPGSDCSETEMWRQKYLCNKWLGMNEELTFKRINFTEVADLKIF